jgi:hypothetical protein
LPVTGLLPLRAQDEAGACNFEPNPSAGVFEDLAKVTDLGIQPDDINALAVAARDPSVDAGEFLLSKGYDQATVNNILSDPAHVQSLNQLVHPSPSRDLLDRAYALLAGYGLPSGALLELYGLTSDPQALNDNLLARGLSPEQADGLANGALGLAAEAQALGVFKFAATLDGQDVLDKNGYDNLSLNSIGNNLDDPDALREQLLQEGVAESDVDGMVSDFQTLNENLGLNENYVNGWNVKTLSYSMDYYGIPSEEILPLAAQGNDEAIRACLTEAGFDPAAIDIAASEFGNYLGGEDGEDPWLTPGDIIESAFDDAGAFAASWGLTGAELAELNQYADDPEAMRDILTQQYGFAPEDADFFAAAFDNSVFAAVLNDINENDVALIDDAITAVENGEYYTLGDDFDTDGFIDEIESENAADNTGDDTGDDTGDNTGGDTGGGDTDGDTGGDTGGDSSGGDESGDGG